MGGRNKLPLILAHSFIYHFLAIAEFSPRVGAGFETKGGCALMLTESVENGVDAIVKYNELHKSKEKEY